jgi:hypothetical protein
MWFAHAKNCVWEKKYTVRDGNFKNVQLGVWKIEQIIKTKWSIMHVSK